MLIDTHIHIVSTDQKKYPIQVPSESTLPGATHGAWFREVPLTVERFLKEMEGAGVDRAVLVQPISAYSYDNSYAADCAQIHPGLFVSVSIIDILAKGAADRLRYWIEERKMSGLRIITGGKDRGAWLDDPVTYPVWERAESLHIPVCIQMHLQHIPKVRRLLERFPGVPVALDHMAHSNVDDKPSQADAEELLDLAKFPNLFLKFSTLNVGDHDKASWRNEFFKQVVDRFGVRRLMWSSNFPASHERSYKEMVDLAHEAVSFVSVADREWLLGRTALTLWPALKGLAKL